MRRGLGYEKINILVYPDDNACNGQTRTHIDRE